EKKSEPPASSTHLFLSALFYTLTMELEAELVTANESSAEKTVGPCVGASILEPYIGMEFDSEADAKNFYDEYARQEGFIVRIDKCHRSEIDNRIISRRLTCNKEGFHVRGKNDKVNPYRKPRVSIREGCEAMMMVKVNKCGKWVVTKFVKEHSHPLMGSGVRSYRTTESKDKRIRQLTKELERRDQQCQQYRKLILSLLETVEEQNKFLSTKVEHVVQCVKQLENDVQKPLDTS
ncbi:hypothetical protein S245_065786, partial [Arachis hypogaea]